VSDDEAIEKLVFDANGVLENLPGDAVHISMSTISVELAERLTSAHAERGQRFVAAPVFGRPEAAEGRELVIVAAGAGDSLARCMPLFEAVGRRTFIIGERPSTANVVKLMGNFLIASMLGSLGESVALTRTYNIDARTFMDVVTDALFPCPVYRGYGARIIADRFTPPGLSLVLGLKDVRLALAAAERVAVSMPIATVLGERAASGVARGMGDWDWASLARVAAQDAGLAPVGNS
jgi:3-hydroxyisobutyrate dehydrogenase-like beta-hydroxyacid dehydrogenase